MNQRQRPYVIHTGLLQRPIITCSLSCHQSKASTSNTSFCLQAEKIMLESEENKEYLPIQGLEAFNKATAELLLGKDHPAIKVPMLCCSF